MVMTHQPRLKPGWRIELSFSEPFCDDAIFHCALRIVEPRPAVQISLSAVSSDGVRAILACIHRRNGLAVLRVGGSCWMGYRWRAEKQDAFKAAFRD